MLTTKGWEGVREDQRAGRAAPQHSRTAARRLGVDRWRYALQDLVETLEAGIVSAAIMGVLAGATLLLIRVLSV